MIGGLFMMGSISHFGIEYITALTYIGFLLSIFFISTTSFFNCISILVSKEYSVKNMFGAYSYLKKSFYIILIFTTFFSVLFWISADVLSLLRINSNKINTMINSFNINFLYIIFPIISCMVLQQFFIAIEKKMVVVCLSIFGSIFYLLYAIFIVPYSTNPIYEYFLCMLYWVIIELAVCAIFLFFFIKRLSQYKINIPDKAHCNKIIRDIVNLGFPMTIEALNSFIVISVGILFIGWISYDLVAVQQTSQQVFVILIVPILAVASSVSILVSHELGLNNILNIRKIIKFYQIAINLIVILYCIIIAIFHENIILMYLGLDTFLDFKKNGMMKEMYIVLYLMAIKMLLDANYEILMGFFKGMQDAFIPILLSITIEWGIGITLYSIAIIFMANIYFINIIGIVSIILILSVLSIRKKKKYHSFLKKTNIEQHNRKK
jgi:Na+-driven multidrug efflux pump